MPIPDILFSVIGVADFLALLLIVAATGFITRKKEHAAENTSAAESGKKAKQNWRQFQLIKAQLLTLGAQNH